MPYQLHPYSNRLAISAGQLPLSDSRLFPMDDKSKLLVVLFWRRLSYSTELRTIACLIWAPQSQSPEQHVWILFVERTKKTLRMMIAIIKQTAGDRQKNSSWRDRIIASTRQYSGGSSSDWEYKLFLIIIQSDRDLIFLFIVLQDTPIHTRICFYTDKKRFVYWSFGGSSSHHLKAWLKRARSRTTTSTWLAHLHHVVRVVR